MSIDFPIDWHRPHCDRQPDYVYPKMACGYQRGEWWWGPCLIWQADGEPMQGRMSYVDTYMDVWVFAWAKAPVPNAALLSLQAYMRSHPAELVAWLDTLPAAARVPPVRAVRSTA